MSEPILGKLERVDPRETWPSEAADFTPWLAANLDKLGAELGLELELEETECGIGDFSADIIARELGQNRVVVVENQLEPTDHRHLGQLLTYAAGKEAGVVVWVSPEFREEHRQAIDWLNRDGGQGTAFFGVVVELLRIDDSKPAVHFRPVAFPNDWKRELQSGGSGNGELSAKREAYQAFFQRLIDDLRAKRLTNAKAAQPQNWYVFASGLSGFVYGVSFAQGGRLRAELYINTPDGDRNKAAFEKLLAQRSTIESDFGEPLEWEPLEGKKACRIAAYRKGSIEDPPEAIDQYLAWAIEQFVTLRKTFGPRLEAL